MSGPVPIAQVTRSGVVEAVHLGSVAVCDADGKLVAWAGDPSMVTYARSSLKPLQAAVSLQVAGEPHPPGEEIAVMCASHNGEPVHLEAVRSLLARAGLDLGALRCPADRPMDPDATDVRPSPERHNCSGNHAGMLFASVRAGLPTASYLDPAHPLQERILAAAADVGGAPVETVGVDGCGAPVPAQPLTAYATMFARLLEPDALGDLGAAASTAVEAMRRHPYLVAGRKRLCTAVMEAVPGAIVKAGAEGLVCAGLSSGLGVAVKVADGTDRPRGPALIAALTQLEALPAGAQERLAPLARPAVLGGGRPTGMVESHVELAIA